MKHSLYYIATLISLTFFTKCSNPVIENEAEQTAKYIANNLDSNSINLLKEYSYGRRGKHDFWQKISGDSTLYACSYMVNGDTIVLMTYRPMNFVKDFPSLFSFDTSSYHQFTFQQIQDSIIGIVRVDHHGQKHKQDTSILTNQLFPSQNPFVKFAELNTLKDKMGFIGTSFISGIGDNMEFWITPQFKLTYLSDTMNMNSTSKAYWLGEFAKGKKIKENWSLLKVYE